MHDLGLRLVWLRRRWQLVRLGLQDRQFCLHVHETPLELNPLLSMLCFCRLLPGDPPLCFLLCGIPRLCQHPKNLLQRVGFSRGNQSLLSEIEYENSANGKGQSRRTEMGAVAEALWPSRAHSDAGHIAERKAVARAVGEPTVVASTARSPGSHGAGAAGR